MDQAVLVNSQVDEGAKVGDVGDHAFQHHVGFQVFDRINLVVKLNRAEFTSRVSPRFGQFQQNVFDGGQSKLVVNKIRRIEFLAERFVADQRIQIRAKLLGHAIRYRVGLWMNS